VFFCFLVFFDVVLELVVVFVVLLFLVFFDLTELPSVGIDFLALFVFFGGWVVDEDEDGCVGFVDFDFVVLDIFTLLAFFGVCVVGFFSFVVFVGVVVVVVVVGGGVVVVVVGGGGCVVVVFVGGVFGSL